MIHVHMYKGEFIGIAILASTYQHISTHLTYQDIS